MPTFKLQLPKGIEEPPELKEVLASIPSDTTSLDLSGNGLGDKTVEYIRSTLAQTPPSVTSLDLSGNGLYQKGEIHLARAFMTLPANVTSLDLSGNNFGNNSAASLARAFSSFPPSVASLNLSGNGLEKKSSEELVQIFSSLPPTVTSLHFEENAFGNKTNDELATIFATFRRDHPNLKVTFGNDNPQRKYNLHCLLESYLGDITKAQENAQDIPEKPKRDFFRNFFSSLKETPTREQEKAAILALQSALKGEPSDLTPHLETLKNGKLGQELRAFVQLGVTDRIVKEKVHTVSGFVEALQNRNRSMQP